jgi:dolichyl-phosphate-mannose--protein O-mannosyl transferase
MTTKQVTRFNFDAEDNSWSIENNGEEVKLFNFIDDTHVDILTRDGRYTRVELSQPGVLAYQQLVGVGGIAFALR